MYTKKYGQKTYGSKPAKTYNNPFAGREAWNTVLEDSGPSPVSSPARSRHDDTDAVTTRLGDLSILEDPVVAGTPSSSVRGTHTIFLDSGDVATSSSSSSAATSAAAYAAASAGAANDSATKDGDSEDDTDTDGSDTDSDTDPQESSDKENHGSTSGDDYIPAEEKPRNILAEQIKESPPRRRGLKKRVSSASDAISSPLKNAAFLDDDGGDSGILVWEDVAAETQRKSRRGSRASRASISSKRNSREKVIPETPGVGGVSRRSSALPEVVQETPKQHSRIATWDSPEVPKLSGAGSIILTPTAPKQFTPEADSDSELSELENISGINTPASSDLSPTETLLSLCTEKRILDFTQHIDSLLHKGSIRKLGEASYSEVFLSSSGDNSTVLKIIPFNKSPDQVDQCAPSAIVQELRITLAMAPIKGYIAFHSCHVVRGSFPSSLLQFWDDYDENHGSENERPDFYEDDQLFAIIGLENGGKDLEHTELRNWEEAEDVFWQVAKALARGEKEREFEHRDLHWGNVVIKRRMEEEVAPEERPEELTLQGLTLEEAGMAREEQSNFEVALIDYTLSRAWCGDFPGGQEYEFMQLDDPALFTGKGKSIPFPENHQE
jgi:hypothetical protein